MGTPSVVYLVDIRKRDLMVAALVGHQLRKRGIECHLLPKEAYRAALGTCRPEMILFNGLAAGHLVTYSRRLRELGVLTAVNLNEGICYDDGARALNAGRHHSQAHVDLFFSWNKPFQEALSAVAFETRPRVEIVGNPRHDFFFDPWNHLFGRPPQPTLPGPKILFCTSFGLAHWHELPRTEVEKFFKMFRGRIGSLEDYWRVIKSHHDAQQSVFKFMDALVEADRFNITIRPHPREDRRIYERWLTDLPTSGKRRIRLDSDSQISSLILNHDLVIGCEDCNTVLESWVARKPTVELEFDKHPFWYSTEVASMNPTCDRPDRLVDVVDRELKNPDQEDYRSRRDAHLARWCASPNGTATERMAEVIAEMITRKRPVDWSQLGFSDHRRAMKLNLTNWLDVPYHYNPFLPFKRLFSERYRVKQASLEGSIRPSEVLAARKILETVPGDEAA